MGRRRRLFVKHCSPVTRRLLWHMDFILSSGKDFSGSRRGSRRGPCGQEVAVFICLSTRRVWLVVLGLGEGSGRGVEVGGVWVNFRQALLDRQLLLC